MELRLGYDSDFEVRNFEYLKGGASQGTVAYDHDDDGLLTSAEYNWNGLSPRAYAIDRDGPNGFPTVVREGSTTRIARTFHLNGYGDLNREAYGPSSFFSWEVTSRDDAGMINGKLETVVEPSATEETYLSFGFDSLASR